jgi:excisionase family DNA binding protein
MTASRRIRIRTACERGGFSRRTAYRLIARGQLTAYKLGNITLLDEAEFERLLNCLPAAEIKSAA